MLLVPLLLAAVNFPQSAAPAAAEPQAPAQAAAKDHFGTTRLTFLLGLRSLDEEYWEPLDDPPVFEADLEWRLEGSAIGFEVGSAISYDLSSLFGVDVDATTFEVFGGVRATWDLADGHLRPYLGVGPSWIYADTSGEQGSVTVSDSDSSLGFYVRAGVAWVFDGGFSLGFDYRKLTGTDISLFDVGGDADFDQFGITFGLGI
jgi:opacity protein-like surface antigen